MEDARSKILARRARFVAAALVAAGFTVGQKSSGQTSDGAAPSESGSAPSASESMSAEPSAEYICEKHPEACVCLKVIPREEVEPRHLSSCGCDTPGRR